MSMRVHELARELGRPNKEVILKLQECGLDVKSHMSAVPDEMADQVRQSYGQHPVSREKQGDPETGNQSVKPAAPNSVQDQENNTKQKAQSAPEGGQTAAPTPKKKKNIIRVYHAQNASDGGKSRKKPSQAGRPTRARNGQAKPVQKKTAKSGKTASGQNQQKTEQKEPVRRQQERPAVASVENSVSREKQQRAQEKQQRAPEKQQRVQEKQQRAPEKQESNKAARENHGNTSNKPVNRTESTHEQKKKNERRSDHTEQVSSTNQNARDGQNRGQKSGNRKHSDKQERIDTAAFAPETSGKSQKESRRERDKKENKNRKDHDKNQGRRTNQNNGRRVSMRLPKALQRPNNQPKEEKKSEVKEIVLPEKLTIRELADAMKMQPSVIVKKLFLEGTMVTVNQEIDFEQAQEIALGYDIIAEQKEKVDVIGELLKEEEEPEEKMIPRPPVVCVMGHVDHGKTSLLDAIRNTHVTDREAGGITQHIGAYVVDINGQQITFLDTPGHEAFTAMRMRGANSTDIAILVVAADDGVMPQTVEAINHAKAAGIEIVVAVNKIDKPGANVERVKQELSEYELVPEDWGGNTIFVPVSARTGEGINELLEMLLLTAEVCELKANPKRDARGVVIEAKLDKGKGSVATILVQKGTLHVGDFIAAGSCSGKVRAMMDDKGRRVKEAGPSMPVEILGLNDVPNAGEILVSFDTDKEAKAFAATFISENKNRLIEETRSHLSLDDLFEQIQAGTLKELPIIVKADVQGSVEALRGSLLKLSNGEVVVKVIHGGVGAITESDVTLASTSNAIVIGFNVRPDSSAKAIAEQEGVDMRLYKVIYQAIEDVEAAMKGMLDPVYEEQVIGHGEVRQLFKASNVGTIAGSYVLDGRFEQRCKIRISRGGKQIYDGTLASLKRFQDDVREVKAGYECGLVFEDFNNVQVDDQVEAYLMVEVPR